MVIFFRHLVYFAAAATLIVFNGCKRQPICSAETHTNSATIELSIDWSESNIDEANISNVSIYAYAENISAPYIKVAGNIYSSSINLPEGRYSLLIFNDFVGDLRGVNFKNSDTYDQFSAEIIARSSFSGLYYELQDGESMSQELDALAAWRMDTLEVSADMVSCSYCDPSANSEIQTILDVTPTAITRRCIILLGVDNLSSAAHIEATVRGLSSGAYLSTDSYFESTEQTTVYSIELDDQTYSSDSDGVAQGEANTFGKLSDDTQTYEVVVDIILNSGELVTYTRDVTDQLLDQDGAVIYIDLTSDDTRVTLPANVSNGFGVESWGENEQVKLF